MKAPKLVLASIALCMSLAAFSQTDTTRRDTTSRRDTTQRKDTTSAYMQNNSSTQSGNATLPSQSSTQTGQLPGGSTQSEGTSKQTFPKPNFGRYHIPVLGSYRATENANSTETATSNNSDGGKVVTVTPDQSNPGKVWIEGLTAVKFYALLKTAPGTYKIPAQKQEEKSIQEGTVAYDDASKQITICVGCGYQDGTISETASTTQTTSKAKVKSKAKSKASSTISFSGVKTEESTVYNQF